MKYFFIDQIVDYDPDGSIVCRWTPKPELRSHELAMPVPRFLMVEAIAQAMSWLTILSFGFSVKPVLGTINNLTIENDLSYGQTATLRAKIVEKSAGSLHVGGSIACARRTILSVEQILVVLMNASGFESAAAVEARLAGLLAANIRGDPS